MPDVLTVAQLAEVVNKLVKQGYGDQPVLITYEGVFAYALSTDFTKPSKRYVTGLSINQEKR